MCDDNLGNPALTKEEVKHVIDEQIAESNRNL